MTDIPFRAAFDQAKPFVAPSLGLEATEDTIALSFADEHADDLRYDHTIGKWFRWAGSHWRVDETRLAFNYARNACRLHGDKKRALSRSATAAGVEKFAQADPRLATDATRWDRDPMLLGTPSGTVDLRTGGIRPACPSEMISKSTKVGPMAGAPERWLKFLHEATNGDTALIGFLQRLCGYSLTGKTHEHILGFIHGDGGNGKSVFLNVLTNAFGEYATTAPMETFTAATFDRHPTELATLRGARLVTASETEEGRPWAEARIKQITGGEPISARFMRQDFFTFTPTFQLVIAGNHAPRLHNVDAAMRRRFAIIPFINKPKIPDRNLEAKLDEELGQILTWMIEGCLLWQRDDNLNRPAVVSAATDMYFEDQDEHGSWIEERCDLGPKLFAGSNELFASWRDYTKAAGDVAGTQKALGAVLAKRGFRRDKISGGRRVYCGLALKDWGAV